MDIRCVLFDADGVLQYPRAGREERLREVLGFEPEPLPTFLEQVHAAEDTTLTGTRDVVDAIANVLKTWGAPERAEQLCEWITWVELDRDMLQTVQRIRNGGTPCALASNQQRHRTRFMKEQLRYPEYFDACFFSCDLGVAKPDAAYFEAILNRLRLGAGQVLFFDDKPENVEGAHSVGIRAEQFLNAENGRAHLELLARLRRYGLPKT